MTKKKISVSSGKNKSENNRHFGVILEDIDSKFKQVLEGHGALDKKIDDLVEEIRGNFKTVFEYFSRIDEELKMVRDEIKDLKTRLNRKADLERLEKLEEKVERLKSLIVKMRNR